MRKNIIVLPVSILFVALAATIYLFGCAKKEQPTREMLIEELGEVNIPVTTTPEVATKTEPKIPQPLTEIRRADNSPSSSLVVWPPPVQEIQIKLKEANLYEGAIDGKYGPKTKAATEEFQKAKGLKVDGKVGTKTIPPLFGEEIQTALKNAGFYSGDIDGDIGPTTKKAIKAFQTANGLKPDGKVGPETWRKLIPYLNYSTEPQENRGK